MPVFAAWAALGFWWQGFSCFLKTYFTNLWEFRLAAGGNLDSGQRPGPRISIPQDIKSFTSFLHHFDEALNALAMTCVACLQSKLFCLIVPRKKKIALSQHSTLAVFPHCWLSLICAPIMLLFSLLFYSSAWLCSPVLRVLFIGLILLPLGPARKKVTLGFPVSPMMACDSSWPSFKYLVLLCIRLTIFFKSAVQGIGKRLKTCR